MVYLDDILIFSQSKEDHHQHLDLVCKRLRQFELYANAKKCSFYQTEIEFLGFIVNTIGLQMDPERIKAVEGWLDHPPKTYRDI